MLGGFVLLAVEKKFAVVQSFFLGFCGEHLTPPSNIRAVSQIFADQSLHREAKRSENGCQSVQGDGAILVNDTPDSGHGSGDPDDGGFHVRLLAVDELTEPEAAWYLRNEGQLRSDAEFEIPVRNIAKKVVRRSGHYLFTKSKNVLLL